MDFEALRIWNEKLFSQKIGSVVWFVYVCMCEEVREWASALGWLLFCSLVWLKTPHSDETWVFFGVNIIVHFRVRKCLHEEDDVGRQTPTLL